MNCVVTPLNFRLLLGVEDTDDVEKYREKKKNMETSISSRLIMRCSIVSCVFSSIRSRISRGDSN